MGLVTRAGALGFLGVLIAVGCGGTDAQGISSAVAEDGSAPPSTSPSGSASSRPGEERPSDAGKDHQDGDDDPGTEDAGSDADASTGFDAGPDSGSPTTAFKMPAKLDDNGTCWQDEFPNPVCKPVPATTPPIVQFDCATGMKVAELRVPPRSCLRVSGRFDPTKLKTDGCFNVDCTPAHDIVCRMWSNTSFTAEDSIRVHYKRCSAGGFTAWWYPIEDCPTVPGCF